MLKVDDVIVLVLQLESCQTKLLELFPVQLLPNTMSSTPSGTKRKAPEASGSGTSITILEASTSVGPAWGESSSRSPQSVEARER
jgi:hypothetical protein